MAVVLNGHNARSDKAAIGNLRVSDNPVVLAVDDMAANLTKIVNMLPDDYEVSVAKSGQDALARLETSFCDVALLDIEMPGMSGIELFEKMLAVPDYATIPVVFVTADGTSESVRKVISMGAKGYIVKPFDSQTLVARITQALSHRTGEDQALLFLRRRAREMRDCSLAGDLAKAEDIYVSVPKSVYTSYVFLILNRVLLSMRNHDFKLAHDTAVEFLANLGCVDE